MRTGLPGLVGYGADMPAAKSTMPSGNSLASLAEDTAGSLERCGNIMDRIEDHVMGPSPSNGDGSADKPISHLMHVTMVNSSRAANLCARLEQLAGQLGVR